MWLKTKTKNLIAVLAHDHSVSYKQESLLPLQGFEFSPFSCAEEFVMTSKIRQNKHRVTAMARSMTGH